VVRRNWDRYKQDYSLILFSSFGLYSLINGIYFSSFARAPCGRSHLTGTILASINNLAKHSRRHIPRTALG
jgi:hypothetical protein